MQYIHGNHMQYIPTTTTTTSFQGYTIYSINFNTKNMDKSSHTSEQEKKKKQNLTKNNYFIIHLSHLLTVSYKVTCYNPFPYLIFFGGWGRTGSRSVTQAGVQHCDHDSLQPRHPRLRRSSHLQLAGTTGHCHHTWLIF